MLTATPGPLTLATNEAWMPSVFRPPERPVKCVPPPKAALTAMARPWYPGSGINNNNSNSHNNNNNNSTVREAPVKNHRLVPPPALGQSPILKPAMDEAQLPPVSSCSSISPLSTPVTTCFHTFTQLASEERVYPLEMFLSVRRDAAHTPYGILRWAVKQYLHIPSLKVPPHLQLSLHEAVDTEDGVARGALGCSLRVKSRVKPVRLTRHKMMSILSRLTPVKYDALHEEMLLLPLRQVDDTELMEICKVVFEKAVQEPSYSGLYARLVHDICAMPPMSPANTNTIASSSSINENEARDRAFSQRFRRMLIASCEAQFRQPLQLAPDELVDRTTGVPLRAEEVELKRDRLKQRLVGNIRFVAELFKMGLVTDRVIADIVRILVSDYDPDEPTAKEEYVFEVFVTLIRHTGAMLKEMLPRLLTQALGIAKTIERSHPKPRVGFLMMDLDDLNKKNGWIAPDLVQQYVREPKVSTAAPAVVAAAAAAAAASSSTQKNRIVASPLSVSSLMSPYVERPVNSNTQTRETPALQNSFNESSEAVISKKQASGNTINNNGNDTSKINEGLNVINTTSCGNTTYNNNNNNSNNNSNINSSNSTNNTGKNYNNISDSTESPLTLAERRWPGKQHSCSNLYITRPNAGSENQLNISINSLQLNSPVTPTRTVSECIIPCSPSLARNDSDMGNSHTTSEGLGSPWINGGKTPVIDTTVNIKEITKKLMGLFRGGEEEAATTMLREMGLKNMVVCLTWWLRLAATNTTFFEDRSKVATLFSSLLRTCSGAYDARTVFSTVLEWIRFDLEKGEYDHCPRMFDNVAQMILQCHLPCNDSLPHAEVVRNMMHCGIFNILLHELAVSGGTDQMVTVVKSCYPVSLQVLNYLQDPEDERQILRIAVQNRFRLLPYLFSVSSVTNNTTPGTPSSRPQMLSSPSLRSSPLGDSFTSTGRYDPLTQCLALQRISDDPEFVLFRKMRDAASLGGNTVTTTTTTTAATSGTSSNSSTSSSNNNNNSLRWRDEAVQLALFPLGNNSTVCELIAVMRVVGAVLACTGVCGKNGRMFATAVDLDYIVGAVLHRRPGILHQGAVVMELVMHYTQYTTECTAQTQHDAGRLRAMRRVFDRWCAADVMNRTAVLKLLNTLENGAAENFTVYTAYHDHVASVAWEHTLHELSEG